MSATLDVNILLYASDEASPLHDQARFFVERMATGPELVYLFWPTIMGYLRIATHPAIFDRPLGAPDAASNINQLLERAHIHAPSESPGFWERYLAVSTEANATGNLVPDAHIVALMVANGVRTIWTRDRDFRRFKGIEARDPFA